MERNPGLIATKWDPEWCLGTMTPSTLQGDNQALWVLPRDNEQDTKLMRWVIASLLRSRHFSPKQVTFSTVHSDQKMFSKVIVFKVANLIHFFQKHIGGEIKTSFSNNILESKQIVIFVLKGVILISSYPTSAPPPNYRQLICDCCLTNTASGTWYLGACCTKLPHLCSLSGL